MVVQLREWADHREAHAAAAPNFFSGVSDCPSARFMATDRGEGRGIASNVAGLRARADELENAAVASAVSRDRADVAERLRSLIWRLDADRVRVRAYNASCRRGIPDVSLLDARQEAQIAAIASSTPCGLGEGGGFPDCHLAALDRTIDRARDRLAALENRGPCTCEISGKSEIRASTPGFGEDPVVAPVPIHPAPRLRTQSIGDDHG